MGNNDGDPEGPQQPEWIQDKLLSDLEDGLGGTEHLPQDLVVFWGYAANAERPECARLYLNIQFNEYIEFEKADMVFSKDMGQANEPLSGIVVWLKKNSPVKHVRVQTLDLQRGFLQGDIVGSNNGGGNGGSSSRGLTGGGGTIVCGGGGTIVCGGGGTIVCGGGGTIVCGGGGTIVCGGGGTIVCGGGGTVICGGGR
ncbi:MAG: hypothetical protein ABI670_06345 [Chloroflexota bacterium]